MTPYVALDNRIFRLQLSHLPADLNAQLAKADKLFLQDRDAEAERLVSHIEAECRRCGIPLADLSFLDLS